MFFWAESCLVVCGGLFLHLLTLLLNEPCAKKLEKIVGNQKALKDFTGTRPLICLMSIYRVLAKHQAPR